MTIFLNFQWLWVVVLCGTFLHGCALSTQTNSPEYSQLTESNIFLLGEVHDNQVGHMERLEDIKTITSRTKGRVAVVLEQINRGSGSLEDPENPTCHDLECLLSLVKSSGWEPAYYKDVLQYGLDNDWVFYAGNLNKSDIRQIMSSGLNSVLPDETKQFGYSDWESMPVAYQTDMIEAMIQGHCGLIDEKTATYMGSIQIGRDIWVSSQISRASEYQDVVIVLAGNGHVRKDMGIPFWLARVGKYRYASFGYIEGQNKRLNQPFDVIRSIPVAKRADPCDSLKERFHKGSITPKR